MPRLHPCSSLLLALAACQASAENELPEDTDTGSSQTTTEPPATDGPQTTDATDSTTSSPDATDPEETGDGPTGTGGSDTGSGTGTDDTGGESGDHVVLQNDSWEPGDGLSWQAWPAAGDCWASVYEPDSGHYPFELVKVEVALGDSSATESFTFAIHEVDGNNQPATEIDSVQVSVRGKSEFTDLVIADLGLNTPSFDAGSFAAVMCHVDHMGLPSIAIDADGTVDADNNWVYREVEDQWMHAPDHAGIDGDFLMRAVIDPST